MSRSWKTEEIIAGEEFNKYSYRKRSIDIQKNKKSQIKQQKLHLKREMNSKPRTDDFSSYISASGYRLNAKKKMWIIFPHLFKLLGRSY